MQLHLKTYKLNLYLQFNVLFKKLNTVNTVLRLINKLSSYFRPNDISEASFVQVTSQRVHFRPSDTDEGNTVLKQE